MLQKQASTHFPTWHYPGRFDGYDLSLFSRQSCSQQSTVRLEKTPQMRYGGKGNDFVKTVGGRTGRKRVEVALNKKCLLVVLLSL